VATDFNETGFAPPGLQDSRRRVGTTVKTPPRPKLACTTTTPWRRFFDPADFVDNRLDRAFFDNPDFRQKQYGRDKRGHNCVATHPEVDQGSIL